MTVPQRLWAPWRVGYITALNAQARGCVFCTIKRQKKDRANYIFTRTKYSYAVLNIYPYNNGHVLIIPNKHTSDLSGLTAAEKKDLFSLLESTKALLDRVLKPQGYNIGMNVGKVAGAGFPGHVHIHIVPRWKGDVNFMPVVSGTKVISTSLRALYEELVRVQQKRH